MSRAKPVRLIDPSTTRVVLLGCGGTGAYVLQSLCRLLYSVEQAVAEDNREPVALAGGALPSRVPEVLVVEGSEVSGRNVLRQGYLPGDVGRNKALVLSERYSAAYGLPIKAYPRYLTPDTQITGLVADGAVVVGCVDNAASRKVLDTALRDYENIVYIDSGNAGVPVPRPDAPITRAERREILEKGWSGQVVCGARKDAATVLPFPADTFPELVEVADAEDRLPTEVPCGELAVSAPQRMTTNLLAANVVLSYLTPLLTEGTVLNCRSLFDARQGYVRSTPAVDEMDELGP